MFSLFLWYFQLFFCYYFFVCLWFSSCRDVYARFYLLYKWKRWVFDRKKQKWRTSSKRRALIRSAFVIKVLWDVSVRKSRVCEFCDVQLEFRNWTSYYFRVLNLSLKNVTTIFLFDTKTTNQNSDTIVYDFPFSI